jgi:hypothetical protein
MAPFLVLCTPLCSSRRICTLYNAFAPNYKSPTVSAKHSHSTSKHQVHNPYQRSKTTLHTDAIYKHHAPLTNLTSDDDDITTKGSKSQAGGFFSTQSTMNTKAIPFVPINDGTVRVTIKWKPPPNQYHSLSSDPDLWESEATAILSQLFDASVHNRSNTFIPWGATTTENPTDISEIANGTYISTGPQGLPS